jgi:putative SOS response-associated peptidase YedK
LTVCGRYSLATPQEELLETFDVPPLTFDHAPHYNIAPGQDAPVVAQDRRGRRLGPMTWGLVPSWAASPGRPFVNARSETVGTTASFREAFASRRCLVPADGFYEWRKEGAARVPFWFHPRRGGVLALAGIWERWTAPGHGARHGFAVLTVEANVDVAEVHHRMPVLLDPSCWDTWLRRDASLDQVSALMVPAPAGTLLRHAVSTRVNGTAQDDPGLVEAV